MTEIQLALGERRCDICGAELPKGFRRFCSRVCSRKHDRKMSRYRERTCPETHAKQLARHKAKRLPKRPCQECGASEDVQKHHGNGYDGQAALDVQYLCRTCHAKEHRSNQQ
jgi:hypothetical protein